jgi:hypothetical protein
MSRKRAAPSIADVSSVSREPVSAGGVQESCLVAAAELFPRRLVFILAAVPQIKLEAVPLLTTKQLQDSQIPFSGDWRCQGGSVRFISALN